MKVRREAHVPQTFRSAVSQVFQPARRATFARPADWKVGDTADGNVRGTKLSGFTLIEIAICLAVVGFALVAIIGVLPMGIQVQTDNRQETIINHDGAYFLDAIRKGAPSADLPLYVEKVTVWSNGNNGPIIFHETNTFRDGHHIVGLLSNPNVLRTEAIVRALTGVASEKGDYNNELAFKYKLTATVHPMETLDPGLMTVSAVASNAYWWQTNLTHEVRLLFRYPLTFDGKTGAGRKVFRAMVSGKVNPHPFESIEYFFYRTGLTNTNVVNIFAP